MEGWPLVTAPRCNVELQVSSNRHKVQCSARVGRQLPRPARSSPTLRQASCEPQRLRAESGCSRSIELS